MKHTLAQLEEINAELLKQIKDLKKSLRYEKTIKKRFLKKISLM